MHWLTVQLLKYCSCDDSVFRYSVLPVYYLLIVSLDALPVIAMYQSTTMCGTMCISCNLSTICSYIAMHCFHFSIFFRSFSTAETFPETMCSHYKMFCTALN
jgi:hypothetical protein